MAPRRKAGRRKFVSLHGTQAAQAQYPDLDERWRRRSRKHAWLLAAAKHSIGEFAEDARVRFSFPLRAGDTRFRAGGDRSSRIACVVLARIRSGKDLGRI